MVDWVAFSVEVKAKQLNPQKYAFSAICFEIEK